MKKILFLDRDGILNEDVAYLHGIYDLRWVPHIVDALLYAKHLGYEFIVVTNQSGVARGYFTVDDVEFLHNYMRDYLEKAGIPILHMYYCPHLPEGTVAEYAVECNCRKPKSGMIFQAMADYDIDREKSFLIGDSQRDIACARGAGIRGYLYNGGNIYTFVKDILDKMYS